MDLKPYARARAPCSSVRLATRGTGAGDNLFGLEHRTKIIGEVDQTGRADIQLFVQKCFGAEECWLCFITYRE